MILYALHELYLNLRLLRNNMKMNAQIPPTIGLKIILQLKHDLQKQNGMTKHEGDPGEEREHFMS